jgi:hypothetical protein
MSNSPDDHREPASYSFFNPFSGCFQKLARRSQALYQSTMLPSSMMA